ncbi:uncharacterized protein BO88DRAFT_464623 [Aspergillus vadensis CBS 113365]|uniref:Zn(2)-C6 fungal-type domain-containing protein n=1 Tax=Aspergillus vadensis (strain CBS 113365 / IMI 142717 / IBT 24658) TaxID=1448311 RepID=A0A319BQ77_ASPVC|nr:hypothetical protein BO88DRAFT_464623 [Aspergillus vadensis CBS 113365]PYH67863.1 hypothetical protein BO88DRAFT_464623 [Aspergillus vadensis CBS 113365]
MRCLGDGKRCHRCEAIGLECIYTESHGRNKRQDTTKGSRAAIRRNNSVSIRTVFDEADNQGKSSQDLSLDDLDCNKFNDGCIDESLFMPWIMNTPIQQSSPGRSRSSSGGIQTPVADLAVTRPPFSARRRSATEAVQDQLPGIPTANPSFASLLGPSNSSSTGDAECWQDVYLSQDDIVWMTTTDVHATVGSISKTLPVEPLGETRTESDNCCLLSSVSFLERLSSKGSSREDCLDLLLADLRNSIETLAVFISCDRCATRVEQNMLLAMAARQIGVICGRMANCCKAIHQGSLSETGSSQRGSEPVPCPIPVNVSVATYCVNRREKLHLLGSLVALQIMDFQRQINIIKSQQYRNRPNKGQVEALSEAENHVKLAQVSLSSDS